MTPASATRVTIGAIMLFVGWTFSGDLPADVIAASGAAGLAISLLRRFHHVGSLATASAFAALVAIPADLGWSALGAATLLVMYLAADHVSEAHPARSRGQLGWAPCVLPITTAIGSSAAGAALIETPAAIPVAIALAVGTAAGVLLLGLITH